MLILGIQRWFVTFTEGSATRNPQDGKQYNALQTYTLQTTVTRAYEISEIYNTTSVLKYLHSFPVKIMPKIIGNQMENLFERCSQYCICWCYN